MKQKLKGGAIAAAIGGSLLTGLQAARPDCDFVLINAQQEETCLTEAQAEAVIDNVKGKNTGFGKSQFSDIKIVPK